MDKEAQDTSQDVAHMVEELHVHDHGLIAPDEGTAVAHEAHHKDNLVGQLGAWTGQWDQCPTTHPGSPLPAAGPAQCPALRLALPWSRSELVLLSLTGSALMKMLLEMYLGSWDRRREKPLGYGLQEESEIQVTEDGVGQTNLGPDGDLVS